MHNKYIKYKSKSNWENYRQQRNLVTKIKKKSIKTYFVERCIVSGPNQSIFGLLSSRLLPTKVAILLKILYSVKR
jgi:hypothetical protein